MQKTLLSIFLIFFVSGCSYGDFSLAGEFDGTIPDWAKVAETVEGTIQRTTNGYSLVLSTTDSHINNQFYIWNVVESKWDKYLYDVTLGQDQYSSRNYRSIDFSENDLSFFVNDNIILVAVYSCSTRPINTCSDRRWQFIEIETDSRDATLTSSSSDFSMENVRPISTCTQLQEMNSCKDCKYALVNNIDCSETRNWNWNASRGVYEGFEPINFFGGFLDGQQFSISNLYIDRREQYAGLFGAIVLLAENSEGIQILNINLINISVSGGVYAGGLAGSLLSQAGQHSSESNMIHNINVVGNISVYPRQVATGFSDGFVGGLLGNINSNLYEISSSSTDVNIFGQGATIRAGSLVGRNSGLIFNSNSKGSVIVNSEDSQGRVTGGYSMIGGLVGENRGFISTSYSNSDVELVAHRGYVGGLVGVNVNGMSSGSIFNSYSTGNVKGSGEFVGGLAGSNIGTSFSAGIRSPLIRHSYSISKVESIDPVTRIVPDYGGFVGPRPGSSLGIRSRGSICEGCFWDIERSGKTRSFQGEGKTSAQMKQQSTFVGWDFETIWSIDPGINEGYPYLRKDLSFDLSEAMFLIRQASR